MGLIKGADEFTSDGSSLRKDSKDRFLWKQSTLGGMMSSDTPDIFLNICFWILPFLCQQRMPCCSCTQSVPFHENSIEFITLTPCHSFYHSAFIKLKHSHSSSATNLVDQTRPKPNAKASENNWPAEPPSPSPSSAQPQPGHEAQPQLVLSHPGRGGSTGGSHAAHLHGALGTGIRSFFLYRFKR